MNQWELVAFLKKNKGKWFTSADLVQSDQPTLKSCLTTKLKKIDRIDGVEKEWVRIKYPQGVRGMFRYRWKE